MLINEKETNVKKICYSTYGNMPFPLVRYKAISDHFFSNDNIVITMEKDKIFETYKVFQYDFSKANEATLSYAVYEFINSRKKEFIVRIVEWDRNKAKKTISEKPKDAQLELNSEIYYISGELCSDIKSMLKEIRTHFKRNIVFNKIDTINLNCKVFIDYNGFSKVLQWGAPFSETQTEVFLDKIVKEICLLSSKIGNNTLPKAEVLFNVCPYEYEKLLLKRE